MNPQMVFKFSKLGNYLQSRIMLKVEIRISRQGNLDFQNIFPDWYLYFQGWFFDESMAG